MNRYRTVAILMLCGVCSLAGRSSACPPPFDIIIYDWQKYTPVGMSVDFLAEQISGEHGAYNWYWTWPAEVSGTHYDTSGWSRATVSSSTPGMYRIDVEAENSWYESDSDYAYMYVWAADIKSHTPDYMPYQGSTYIYTEIRSGTAFWRADTVTLEIRDGSTTVRTFNDLYHYTAQEVGYYWDGKDDYGQWVPGGDYTIEFSVTKDGRTHSDTHDISVGQVTVSIISPAPEEFPVYVPVGEALTLECETTGAGGGDIEWLPQTNVSFTPVAPDGSIVDFVASVYGEYTATVEYTEGSTTASAESGYIRAFSTEITTPSSPTVDATIGEQVDFVAQVWGATGGTFAWNCSTPSDITITGEGTARFTATEAGTYTVEATYTIDGATAHSASTTVHVQGPTVQITTPAASYVEAEINQGVNFVCETSPPTGGTVTWIRSPTQDCSISVTGARTATFTATQAGTYTVKARFEINGVIVDSTTTTVHVQGPTVQITMPSTSSIEAAINQPVYFACQTSPPTGGTVTWIRSPTPNCSITATGARTATFTATQAGTYTVKASFEISGVIVESATKTVIISAPSVTINSPSSDPYYRAVNQQLQLGAQVSGVTGGTYSWGPIMPGVVTWTPDPPNNTSSPTFSANATGYYDVQVTYTYGTSSLTDTVRIGVIGVQIIEPQYPGEHIDMEVGDQAPVTCIAQGTGGGTYTWAKGANGAGTLTFSPNGSTSASSSMVTASQADKYTAQVTYTLEPGGYTVDHPSGWIYVTNPFVSITGPSADVFIELGDVLDLTCEPSSRNYLGTFTWSKASGTGTVGFPTAPTSTLEDTVFAAGDIGDYTVQVAYLKGGVTDVKTSPIIHVTGLDVDLAVTSPADFNPATDHAGYGEPIGLTCTPSGSGGNLTWSVTPSTGATFSPPDPSGATEVTFVGTPTAVTTYTITVTYEKQNPLVSTSTSDSVAITVNPCSVRIVEPAESPGFVHKDDLLPVRCQVSGIPDGAVTWSVPPASNCTITPDGDDPFLASFTATVCGEYEVVAHYTVPGLTVDSRPVTIVVWETDLDVDANRDGFVNQSDEGAEETQSAIVPVNCDDDDSAVQIQQNPSYVPYCDYENDTVDGATDMEDFAPVIIRRADAAGWTITLTTDGSHPFNVFRWGVDTNGNHQPDATEMVRIGSPHVIQNTGGVDEVERLHNADLTYYIEAKRFPLTRNEVYTLTLTAQKAGYPTRVDVVKVRPSPFILPPATHEAEEVFVMDEYTDGNPNDDPFVTALGSVTDIYKGDCGSDPWFQDLFEIGFTSWPVGGNPKVMPVVWSLPRALRYPLAPTAAWIKSYFLGTRGWGYVTDIKDASGNGFDAIGGDLEVIPTSGGGVIITGTDCDEGIKDFFAAQGIQCMPGTPPIVRRETMGWLATGHIDEVVTFLGGTSVAIANCGAALDILQDMNDVSERYTGAGAGTNTLTNVGFALSTTTYKQGNASADIEASEADWMYIYDSSLCSGYPLKNGDTNKQISVAFWVRFESLPAVGSGPWLYGKSATDKKSIWIGTYNSGGTTRIALGIGVNGGTSWQSTLHSGALALGVWYYVAATYDDSTRAYRIRVWDDGAQAILGTDATGNFTSNINVEDAYVFLGYLHDGWMDALTVFNDVLTVDEIDQIRQGTYPLDSDPDCKAVWNFDNGALTSDVNCRKIRATGILQYGGAPLVPADWIGGFIEISSGAANGQVRKIKDITTESGATAITVTRAWDADNLPGTGSVFRLFAPTAYQPMFAKGSWEIGVATGGTAGTLVDSTKSWNGEYNSEHYAPANEPEYDLYRSYIMIVEGTGAGDAGRIATSQGNTITLGGDNWTTPDTTSRYVIVKYTKTHGYRWSLAVAQDTDYDAPAAVQWDPAFTTVRGFLLQYTQAHLNLDAGEILDIEQAVAGVLGPNTSFIRVPSLYRLVDTDRGLRNASWMPQMVNLLNRGSDGLFMAEPFVSGVPPMFDDFNESFKESFNVLTGTDVHYVDDWYFLHTGTGEVHCGTNVKRAPEELAQWWNLPGLP